MERARQIHEYLAEFCWRTTGAAAAAAGGGAPPAPPGPPPGLQGGMDVDGTFGGGGGLADSFYQGNDSKFSVAEATFQCPTSMYFKTVSSKMVAGIDVNSQVPLKMLNEEMRKGVAKTSPVERMQRVLATLEQVKLLKYTDMQKHGGQLAATISLVDTRSQDSREVSFPLQTKADRQRFWQQFKAISIDTYLEGVATGVAGFVGDLGLNRKKNWQDAEMDQYKASQKTGGAATATKRKRKPSTEGEMTLSAVNAAAPPPPTGLPSAAQISHIQAAAVAQAAATHPGNIALLQAAAMQASSVNIA